MSEVTDCLFQALSVVRDSKVLDEQAKEEVLEPLQRIIKSERMNDREKVAAMGSRMHQFKENASAAKVAQEAAEIKAIQLDSLNGESLFRMVTPTYGNRGDPDSPSFTSQTGWALRRVGRDLQQALETVVNDSWGLMRDSGRAHDFVLAAEGGHVNDPEVRAAADQYHEVLRKWVQRAREAGFWVPTMENYFPHSHHFGRVQANHQEWHDFLVRNLDTDYHPDPEATVEALYATLAAEEGELSTSGSLSFGRQIHIATPEARTEYFFRYGSNNVSNSVLASAEKLVDAALVSEKFSPRYTQVVENQAAKIKQRNQQQLARSDLSKERRKELMKDTLAADRAKNTMQSLFGGQSAPGSQNMANWGGVIRNTVNGRLLGKVALSAMTQDALTGVLRSRQHGVGTIPAMGNLILDSFRFMTKAQQLEYVKELGIWDAAIVANSHHRISTQFEVNDPTVGGGAAEGISASEKWLARSGQYASWVQRVALSQSVERGARSAFTLNVGRGLWKYSNKRWRDLPARYRDNILVNNGVTEADWNKLNKQRQAWRGTRALNTRVLDTDLQEKIEQMIVREAEVGVTLPNARDRMFLHWGGSAGTFAGEASQMFLQYMSWPIGFFRNAYMSEWNQGKLGVLGYTGAMVAAGVMQKQLYAIAGGREAYAWEDPNLWVGAVARSAVLTPVFGAVVDSILWDQVYTAPVLSLLSDTTKGLFDTGVLVGEGEFGAAAGELLMTAEELAVPNIAFVEAQIQNVAEAAQDQLN